MAKLISLRRLGYALALAGVAGIFVWWLTLPGSVGSDNASNTVATATMDRQIDRPRTLGDAWPRQWTADIERRVSERPDEFFDIAEVRRRLGRIELNDAGEIVLNDSALSALRGAFATLEGRLDTASLQELEQLIRRTLPGRAGEQTAQVVGDYYRYDRALRSFDAGAAVADDLTRASVRQEQLAALRMQYFGPEVANKLFAREQAYARYTIESMRIQAAADLSAEQKARLQARLKDGLPADVLPGSVDADWKRRYALFERDKQAVLSAGLTDTDKAMQIERLLEQYFRPEERAAARGYVPEPDG